MWVETRCQYGISALSSFLRRHLAGKLVVASLNVGCFLGLLYVRLGSKIIFLVAENMPFCFSLKPQKRVYS